MIHCLAGHAGHASRAGRISCSGSAGYVTRAVCVVDVYKRQHLPPFPFPPKGKSFFQWKLLLNLLYQILQFVFLSNISRILRCV